MAVTPPPPRPAYFEEHSENLKLLTEWSEIPGCIKVVWKVCSLMCLGRLYDARSLRPLCISELCGLPFLGGGGGWLIIDSFAALLPSMKLPWPKFNFLTKLLNTEMAQNLELEDWILVKCDNNGIMAAVFQKAWISAFLLESFNKAPW